MLCPVEEKHRRLTAALEHREHVFQDVTIEKSLLEQVVGFNMHSVMYMYRDVNNAKARHMQRQGQRPKTENAKVYFRVNATVNPVYQFRVIFTIL